MGARESATLAHDREDNQVKHAAKNELVNCVCDVCQKLFYASRPRAAKYCSAVCKSMAYRSRKNEQVKLQNHTPTPDEAQDLRRIEACSPTAARALRSIMTMYGRAAFELATDAVWDSIVACGGMVR